MDFRVRLKFRAMSRPEKGLRALKEYRPRFEPFAERVAGKARPALFSIYQIRRKLATAAVAIFTAWLFAHVMFGANGMVVYRQKKAEYQTLEKQIDHLQKENNTDTAQIKALKTDPKAIEQEAREQLHYVRPGEVVYVSPSPTPAQHPALDSARK
jgi:cell division protein FtsB